MSDSKLIRPEPVLNHKATPIDRSTPPLKAAEQLRDGATLIVTDVYATGLNILTQLRTIFRPPSGDTGYEARRSSRSAYRDACDRLLVPIVKHRLDLAEAPAIGFLRELYPDKPNLVLPFLEVQNLNSSWNWYRKGVHLKVLGYRIHPFYGTYVPTRVTHLELFATWLSQYKGPRERAIDVGTGCGVLALQLCAAGFETVLATDCNPNAIESVRRDMAAFDDPPPIKLFLGDLLGDDPALANLIVFNPPWMQGTIEGPLDGALYYEGDLFERFFDKASKQLTSDGRVIMVFSNLIELVQPDVPHPIKAELESGRFRLVQKLVRKVKPSPTKHGRKRRTREKIEIWELALAEPQTDSSPSQ